MHGEAKPIEAGDVCDLEWSMVLVIRVDLGMCLSFVLDVPMRTHSEYVGQVYWFAERSLASDSYCMNRDEA